MTRFNDIPPSASVRRPVSAPQWSLDRGGELESSIRRASQFMLGLQERSEGYWWSELEANTTLTSEYVFLRHMLRRLDPERGEKCKNELLASQETDGGWGIGDGKGGELSTTVEAYIALRFEGCAPDHPQLDAARKFVLSHGGLGSVRVFTRIYLALMGFISYTEVPMLPVWMLLLPKALPMNIYEMSSWARSCVVPLSVLIDKRAVWSPKTDFRIDELTEGRPVRFQPFQAESKRAKAFLWIDRRLHWCHEMGAVPYRHQAYRYVEEWILRRQDDEGDWGGIYPAIAFSMLALCSIGYSNDDPNIRRGWDAIDRFGIETDDRYRMQSCISPIWDTALAAWSLRDSGVPANNERLVQAGNWLLAKQIFHHGDWKFRNSEGRPGAWSFEFHNRYYPDCDDTSAVIIALSKLDFGKDNRRRDEAVERGRDWVLSMQGGDGGWAAFDRNERAPKVWNKVPFADHGAMLDHSSPDLSGRVLEMLAATGGKLDAPPVLRALSYLEKEQRSDGSWYGRWGVNYIYGTWAVLSGLCALGMTLEEPMVARGVQFLEAIQSPDGGWGESCLSYDENRYVPQEPCASQTAWAVMGLLAAYGRPTKAIRSGIAWLLSKQNRSGDWDEAAFTGTGFPLHFYIRYHLYRNCFPLMALGLFERVLCKDAASSNETAVTKEPM